MSVSYWQRGFNDAMGGRAPLMDEWERSKEAHGYWNGYRYGLFKRHDEEQEQERKRLTKDDGHGNSSGCG